VTFGRSSARGLSSVAACCAMVVLFAGCGASRRSVDATDDDTRSEGGANAGGSAGTAGTAGTGSTVGSGGSAEVSTGGEAGASGAAGAAEPPLPCSAGIAPTSQVRRLTNEQYDRTVRDLVGVTALAEFGNAAPSSLLAPDHSGNLTDADWEGYMLAGEAIAAQVMADAGLRSRFIGCTPTGDGSACLRDTVVAFGRRAFRRPLSDADIARFDAIIAAGAEITETGAAEEVAEVLLNTFLVSPSFIQRSELSTEADADGNFPLSAHELAARLSYTLWGSMPDVILNRAADAGEITSLEQIRAQAERMLTEPRAREQVDAFHQDYLMMRGGAYWDDVQKDTSLYPLFTAGVASVLKQETLRFFDAVVFDEGGSFQDLFSSEIGFVNADTALLYGLDPAQFGAELEPVTLDPDQRPGFLTRVGFLSAFSHYESTAPILRGVFVTSRVLGIDLGADPSAGLPPPADDFLTNRQQTEAVTSPPACAGCHTYINPPGFVLEAYDTTGRWQTLDPMGGPIDTTADVHIDGASVTVESPADLMSRLAASEDAQLAYVRRWIGHAYERPVHALDSCIEQELALELRDPEYSILSLLSDLTQSDSFRVRALETP
jgi:hypothetical protein